MRIAYLAMDRPDMLWTTCEMAANGPKEPASHHSSLLKFARYLTGAPHLAQSLGNELNFTILSAWSDSGHVDCVKTHNSPTDSVQLGTSVIKAIALGQAVIVLSTGEAEYCGLISTASAALGESGQCSKIGASKCQW